MDRRLLVVALLSAVLGALAMLWLRPDTSGPEVARTPAPASANAAPARPVAVARPVAPRVPRAPIAPVPSIPMTIDDDDGGPAVPGQFKEIEPGDFGPLDQLYEPDHRGLTAATFGRSDRLRKCWIDHGGLDLDSRFTVKITVADGEEGTGKLDADVLNFDAPQEMVDCVSDAMSDATFPSPGDVAVTMVVPIPVPERAE